MMNNPITQSELAEVLGEIREGFTTICDRLNQLEKGQVEMKAELKGDIKEIQAELKGDIKEVSAKVSGIDTRLCNVESSVQKIPDLFKCIFKARILINNI